MIKSSGLDPSGPLFENTKPKVRLDPTDATFVDVMHTNAGSISSGGRYPIQCIHI